MNKFENIYQDAALMRKFLLGEANEAERKELEKRLAECPDLKKVYEQLQNGETLKAAFGEYKDLLLSAKTQKGINIPPEAL